MQANSKGNPNQIRITMVIIPEDEETVI